MRRRWRPIVAEVLAHRAAREEAEAAGEAVDGPGSPRRPALWYVAPPARREREVLGAAAHGHLLVLLGGAERAGLKEFGSRDALLHWWVRVPEQAKRSYNTARAPLLPRWGESATPFARLEGTRAADRRARAAAAAAPGAPGGGERGGGGHSATVAPPAAAPRVKGGAIPRARRFVPSRPGAAPAGMLPPRPPPPRGGAGGGAGEGEGRAGHAEELGAYLDRRRHLADRAQAPHPAPPRYLPSRAAPRGTGGDAGGRLMRGVCARGQAVRQAAEVEELHEVAASRARLEAAKRENAEALRRMRRDARDVGHPLYAYGDRFARAFVSPRGPRHAWRGDRPLFPELSSRPHPAGGGARAAAGTRVAAAVGADGTGGAVFEELLGEIREAKQRAKRARVRAAAAAEEVPAEVRAAVERALSAARSSVRSVRSGGSGGAGAPHGSEKNFESFETDDEDAAAPPLAPALPARRGPRTPAPGGVGRIRPSAGAGEGAGAAAQRPPPWAAAATPGPPTSEVAAAAGRPPAHAPARPPSDGPPAPAPVPAPVSRLRPFGKGVGKGAAAARTGGAEG